MKTKYYLAVTAVVVSAIAVFVWLKIKADPEGHSRRPPHSMHAHQSRWPSGCSDHTRSQQSPIALSTTQFLSTASSNIKLKPAVAPADLVDVGHTFQLRYGADAPGGKIVFEGADYDLRQFHFHKPSEHVIDGKQFEMEAHFVFLPTQKTSATKAVVLGFPINVGADSEEISKIWKHLPPFQEGYGEKSTETVQDWNSLEMSHELNVDVLSHHEKKLASLLPIDLTKLLPRTALFFVYQGSLTTPDCDEGIIHAVSLTPMEMGHEQTEHFEGYYEGSNRDIQPVGPASNRNFRRATLVTDRI